jgi:pimeloyl-ACP methyl ester carboxylesterase
VPTAPYRIVHIADWHWMPVGECNDTDNRELVEQIQQQQMEAIRVLDVREVWIEGQSDETIADFRRHVLRLGDVKLPDGDSPTDQFIRDLYAEDLLQIGAAGRLLLAGEIDDVLPLEDHEAWRASQPVDCVIGPAANGRRERAMAKRLPSRAVIVLGVGHDLSKWLPGEFEYLIERVEALPE